MMAIFKTTFLMVVLPYGIWLLAYGTQLTVAQNVQSIDDDDQAYRNDARVNLENPTKATTTKAPTTPSPLTSCPSNHELGSNRCICFTNTRTLLCSHFSGSFALTNHYLLDRLVIAYSDHTDLSMLTQLISSGQLIFKSLLIQNNRNLQRIDPQLFQIITDKITIGWNSNLESIDWSQLQPLLSSISINFVKSLLNFNTTNKIFVNLKELHFDNLNFNPENGDTGSNFVIDKLQFPALKSLFVHSTNLGGTVRIAMADKSQECEEYNIDIQYHEKMSYFDFGALFPSKISSNTSGCHRFKVNLSNNNKMSQELLIDQLSVLDQYAANLEVYLENVPLYCNCDLYNLYNNYTNNFKLIYCEDRKQLLKDLTYDKVC